MLALGLVSRRRAAPRLVLSFSSRLPSPAVFKALFADARTIASVVTNKYSSTGSTFCFEAALMLGALSNGRFWARRHLDLFPGFEKFADYFFCGFE